MAFPAELLSVEDAEHVEDVQDVEDVQARVEGVFSRIVDLMKLRL
jgi:hypothetical protein